ncbi:hypothetical protein C8T65DRAFT_706539 [Cerioporus squamosus]|nr:hypothetical protein C8T65DRAFT_706539 [Cerioporus squamosus]
MDTSATELPVQDDQVSASPSSNPTSSSTPSSDPMTGMILALSLSLAIALILFMMGIHDDRDAEKTASVRGDADSEQRMWARASAKWLANRKAVAKSSDSTLLNDRQPPRASSSAVSLTRTYTTSDRNSTYSSRPRSVRSRSPAHSRSRMGDNDDTPSSPLHPPAYPSELTSSYQTNPPPPCSAPQSRPTSPVPYEPPINSAHVATDDKNVLAHMVRLASAPPPADACASSHGGSSELYPSVPILEDDGFEPLPPELQSDVDVHVSGERAIRGPPHSGLAPDAPLDASSPYPVPSYTEDALRHRALVLPPPPSKIALAGPMFYEYPNEFEEDVATTEPPLGPSSPPFEEEPFAPPFRIDEGLVVAPSAPPLDSADELPPTMEMLSPSAPPLEHDEHEYAISIGTSLDSHEDQRRAPQGVPDDHTGVSPTANAGVASLRQPSAYGARERSRSPPEYLP